MELALFRIIILALLVATPAFAQHEPDATTYQRAIAALQQQRNRAMDDLVNAEIELAKLRAEIEALKKKLPAESKE
jgi:predicted  nucleic acid-binding Zn-ribbon protein